MRERQYPSDLMMRRAAFIWAQALRKPSFDNGDPSLAGAFGQALHHENMSHDISKAGDVAAKIDRFEAELVLYLQKLRDNDGKPMSEEDAAWERKVMGERSHGEPTYYFRHMLGVDYHPDATLRYAADRAGVPASMFSWKSTIFFTDKWVSCSFGYGAGDTYHYPLEDGRWLLTDMRSDGGDIEAVKRAVLGGTLSLRVEDAMPELAALEALPASAPQQGDSDG